MRRDGSRTVPADRQSPYHRISPLTTHRKFDPTHDFEKVNQFLRDCYEPQNADGNWIQPIWDYSYYHGNTDLESLSNISVWENQGQMVAVTVFGTDANDVCLCTLNSFQSLKPEMLEYAEQNLARPDAEGNGALNVFVHESNIELSEILRGAGYDRRECDRTFSHCDIPPSTAETILPDGFELKSLEEDNDIRKINKVMWRGFNHPGEPPDDHLPSRRRMQSSPNFRFDLTTVAVAPNGDYASFCGMWYDTDNRFGYVEPVATDPDDRRQGLGKATVMESMRKCRLLGAEVAYVWSDTPFYRSIGFGPLYKHHCWTKSV